MNKTAFLGLFIGILLVISVNADFYTDFRSPRAVCDEKQLKIITVHNGRIITPDQIVISAVDELGYEFSVTGKWYIDGQEVSYIRGKQSANDFTDVVFIADTLFPKNQNYRIKFSYKRTLDTEDYTVLQMVANCPGKFCKSDINCADNEVCSNETGRCTNLRCNVCQKPYLNRCVPKCADYNICTKDICREGICSYEEVPNCCAKDADCNDKLTCTTDSCINQRCEHKPVQCVGTEVCVSGTCAEGKGCQYETNLTCLNEENRRYVLQLGSPDVVKKESTPTNIISWILTVMKNFFS